MKIIEIFSFISDVYFVVLATLVFICISVFIVKEIINMFRSSKIESVTCEELEADVDALIVRHLDLMNKFEACLREVRSCRHDSLTLFEDVQKNEDKPDEI